MHVHRFLITHNSKFSVLTKPFLELNLCNTAKNQPVSASTHEAENGPTDQAQNGHTKQP